MSKAAGFIVRLSVERQAVFAERQYEESFAEPVTEFSHSRNTPLICFVVDSTDCISHITLGKRGKIAGTDLRRLNLEQIYELQNKVPASEIWNRAPSKLRRKIEEKTTHGGVLPPKSFQAIIQILGEIAPDSASILQRYSEAREKRVENIPARSKAALAEQKEAVATALSIAGINRDELLGWDLGQKREISSFLDGLQQVRLREDQMVINDLMQIPGYEEIKKAPHNSVVFENDQSKLTVILANRLPLENQLGTDLIYYNETFSCFLMVQYKAMEKEEDEDIYRFPNAQLTGEIDRMNSVLQELKKYPSNDEADGFRLSESPFFLKICPRIAFNPDNVGLVKGMYLPLGYWKLLSEHPSMIGSKGGKRISYRNVRRYFDNSAFISIAGGGWVGTNSQQSLVLEAAIRSTLESGRVVVLAVNIEKDERHRVNG